MSVFSASITAEPLLFKELKSLIVYLDHYHYLEKEIIYKKVIEDNLFQYKSPKSSLRRLNSLYKRYASLSSELRNIITHASFSDAAVVVLYGIYKSNPLFQEFMHLVIGRKLKNNDQTYSNKDVYNFLDILSSDHPEMHSWKDVTRKKMTQVLTRIIREALVLSSNNLLQRPLISPPTKALILKDGGKNFINSIE